MADNKGKVVAQDKKPQTIQQPAPVVPAPAVDYSTYTADQLLDTIGKAYAAKDMKLMGALSRLYTKKEADAEKAKKDALLAELIKVTAETLESFTQHANKLVDTGNLDGAEGIWFAYDFGAIREKGINPSLRLVKAGRKPSTGGSTNGSGSYVAGLPSSASMLEEAGDKVYITKATNVTIDKVDHMLPVGMTYREAYKYSTNGGWRNRVRMALGTATGRKMWPNIVTPTSK